MRVGIINSCGPSVSTIIAAIWSIFLDLERSAVQADVPPPAGWQSDDSLGGP
jgi:hypothetical protein